MKFAGVCTKCGLLTSPGQGSRHPWCGPKPRPSLRARGYPRDWPARRAAQLRREPRCEDRSDGPRCRAIATDVDHRVNRRLLVRRKHPDPDGAWNLQSLCHPHHSRKTAIETRWSEARRRSTMGRRKR